ncbi:hypothetical protein [Dyadobacter alkalitolerans]|uniref:hypothetical protein n=1 Tax=Dyadobacter alkalitolerans TaxID=492736 RepID=UPI00047B3C26|nr:hypothetical protein [Dyadobacter alkalitolerans]
MFAISTTEKLKDKKTNPQGGRLGVKNYGVLLNFISHSEWTETLVQRVTRKRNGFSASSSCVISMILLDVRFFLLQMGADSKQERQK